MQSIFKINKQHQYGLFVWWCVSFICLILTQLQPSCKGQQVSATPECLHLCHSDLWPTCGQVSKGKTIWHNVLGQKCVWPYMKLFSVLWLLNIDSSVFIMWTWFSTAFKLRTIFPLCSVLSMSAWPDQLPSLNPVNYTTVDDHQLHTHHYSGHILPPCLKKIKINIF